MIVHLVLLLLLAFIATPAGSELTRLMLTAGDATQEAPVAFLDAPAPPTETPVESEMDPADVFEEVQVESLVDSVAITDPTEFVELPDLFGAEISMDAPMFGGRTGAVKQALMTKFGATTETQNAVELGLQWLKKYQRSNGSWSLTGPYSNGVRMENKCAATSMAILAFLGNGDTHKSGDYQEEVDKALHYLIDQQDRSGLFARRTGDDMMYAQAQATMAICEAYGMTGDSWLKIPAQAALDFAQKAQSKQGGWRYRVRGDSDTSVTGWFVMALKSGHSAGLRVDHSVLQHVHTYLDSAQSYDGAGYGYLRGAAPSPAMSAEGLLCRQYLGWPHDSVELKIGAETLVERHMFDINNRNVYYWYYASQMLHHHGGEPWTRWNNVMKVQLPKDQVVRGVEAGSWAPQGDRWGTHAGRLYQTCLSIYCLEVYYRHMPLYQGDKKKEI